MKKGYTNNKQKSQKSDKKSHRKEEQKSELEKYVDKNGNQSAWNSQKCCKLKKSQKATKKTDKLVTIKSAK